MKRPRPPEVEDSSPSTVDSSLIQSLAWLESRVANVFAAVPLDAGAAVGSSKAGSSGSLSAAIHARRLKRRINASLLAEEEPIPLSQIKVVRGCVTVTSARPAAPKAQLPVPPRGTLAEPLKRGRTNEDAFARLLQGIIQSLADGEPGRLRPRMRSCRIELARVGHVFDPNVVL